MTNPIVTVNVTQQIAPAPSTLQRTGALLSQGGTDNAPGTSSLLTQPSDLLPILAGSRAVTAATQSGGTATITTTAPHGFVIGDTLLVTLAGFVPTAYNGTFLVTVTDTTHFTYPVTGSPGTASVEGVYTVEDVAELQAMVTTFFAQGTNNPVFILELGAGNASDGALFLTNWIIVNPNVYYSYLVPREWDGNPVFLELIASYENDTAKTYFWVTTTLATWQNYTAAMKDVNALIEVPAYGAWSANALTAISYAAAYPDIALTAIAWASTAGGTVTAATMTPHGVPVGSQFTISGCTPDGYNGTFIALAGTGGTALIYALATDPGAESALGQINGSAFGAVTATTTTAHGVAVGQWFTIAGCVPTAYNGTWEAIAGTTGSTLIYAVPNAIAAETVLGTLIASYYVSTGVPPAEFSQAAPFWRSLSYQPSSTNKVTPFSYGFLFGVTPFPTAGNGSILTTLKNANISVIGTGAQGGISNTLVNWGNMLDGRPFNYWYSADYAQINLALDLSNAIINGSNNPGNPLYNNQPGITALEGVAASTMTTMISVGLALGRVVQTALDGEAYALALAANAFAGQAAVNAVPFTSYYTINESDYARGIYNGLSVIYAPLRGFDHITVNLVLTDFVAGP